jgi:hypothetical protein
MDARRRAILIAGIQNAANREDAELALSQMHGGAVGIDSRRVVVRRDDITYRDGQVWRFERGTGDDDKGWTWRQLHTGVGE